MGADHLNPKILDMTHTPGPWNADGYHVRQNGQGGTRMIADVCYTGPHHTPPDEYPKSCRIADEANARLIAAAPELLEALRECLSIIGKDPRWEWVKTYRQAHDAIAKATSEK